MSLHPKARTHFEDLAEAIPVSDLGPLRDQVQAHAAAIRAAAKRNELLPVDMADALAAALGALLDAYPSLTEAHRALVIGAARYFISHHDHQPDLGSVLGLDDDVAVFNHVARELGRTDLLIDG